MKHAPFFIYKNMKFIVVKRTWGSEKKRSLSFSLSLSLTHSHTHTHVHVHIYIYIYIGRPKNFDIISLAKKIDNSCWNNLKFSQN